MLKYKYISLTRVYYIHMYLDYRAVLKDIANMFQHASCPSNDVHGLGMFLQTASYNTANLGNMAIPSFCSSDNTQSSTS